MNKELNDFIASSAKSLGYTVLEVALKGRSGLSVEITLDKEGRITLEECAEFNRMVSLWLEKSDAGTKGYTVDVASPGLDRILKSDLDFSWAVGKRVRVHVSSGGEGGHFYEGELKSAEAKTVVIVDPSGKNVEIEKKNIVKAQLSPEI